MKLKAKKITSVARDDNGCTEVFAVDEGETIELNLDDFEVVDGTPLDVRVKMINQDKIKWHATTDKLIEKDYKKSYPEHIYDKPTTPEPIKQMDVAREHFGWRSNDNRIIIKINELVDAINGRTK